MKKTLLLITLLLVFSAFTYAQDSSKEKLASTAAASIDAKIPAYSKVYVAPMEGDFNTYITAALHKKKIPLTIVASRELADFEIKGSVDKQKAGWAKTIFVSPNPEIDATMQVINLKTGVVAFSNSSTKVAAHRGRKGSAEHLAKNLAKKMQDEGEMKKD